MLKDLLQELGLNPTETALFVTLYENGPQTASKAANIAKINRTTAYMALQNLEEKGLVYEDMELKVSRFVAEKPKALLGLITKREDHLKC